MSCRVKDVKTDTFSNDWLTCKYVNNLKKVVLTPKRKIEKPVSSTGSSTKVNLFIEYKIEIEYIRVPESEVEYKIKCSLANAIGNTII